MVRLVRNVAQSSHGRSRSTCTSVGPPRTQVANGTETDASASQARPWLPGAPCRVLHVEEDGEEAATRRAEKRIVVVVATSNGHVPLYLTLCLTSGGQPVLHPGILGGEGKEKKGVEEWTREGPR